MSELRRWSCFLVGMKPLNDMTCELIVVCKSFRVKRLSAVTECHFGETPDTGIGSVTAVVWTT